MHWRRNSMLGCASGNRRRLTEARERITEVIELADQDVLDIARSRAAEQEVLDLLDEPPTR